MSHPLRLDPARFFPAEPRVQASPGTCSRGSKTCRSSVRTATPIRLGSPQTRRSPTRAGLMLHPGPLSAAHAGYSQGVRLEQLGVPPLDGGAYATDRSARGLATVRRALSPVSRHAIARCGSTTPSPRCSGSTCAWKPTTADHYFDAIGAALAEPRLPASRALFERFAIEVLATTERRPTTRSLITPPCAPAAGQRPGDHRPSAPTMSPIRTARISPPALERLGEITGEDAAAWRWLSRRAPGRARAAFRALGATATDHGPPTARAPPTLRRRRRGACSQPLRRPAPRAGRGRAVPRPDADRDGAA